MTDHMLPPPGLRQGGGDVQRAHIPIGFGTAALFSLPTARQRRTILFEAYDAGLRHFDVAPIYGLGCAEKELRALLGPHRADVTVTTKVGLYLTTFASLLGTIQALPRAALQRLPRRTAQLRRSAAGPTSGRLGRLLYTSSSWDVREARVSLQRSLDRLNLDYIDYLLIHDPQTGPASAITHTVEFLSEASKDGRIKNWGIAGQVSSELLKTVREAGYALPVHQLHDDVFSSTLPAALSPEAYHFTFGALTRALPTFSRYLGSDDCLRRQWNDRFGMDLFADARLSRLLLAEALLRNPGGTYLISTTQQPRLRSAVAASEDVATGLASELSPLLRSLARQARDASGGDFGC